MAMAHGHRPQREPRQRRWWFEADAWCDPEGQREFLARVDTYRSEGPPPAEQRMNREEVRSRFGF